MHLTSIAARIRTEINNGRSYQLKDMNGRYRRIRSKSLADRGSRRIILRHWGGISSCERMNLQSNPTHPLVADDIAQKMILYHRRYIHLRPYPLYSFSHSAGRLAIKHHLNHKVLVYYLTRHLHLSRTPQRQQTCNLNELTLIVSEVKRNVAVTVLLRHLLLHRFGYLIAIRVEANRTRLRTGLQISSLVPQEVTQIETSGAFAMNM
jgi:hypothetical protein